MVRIFEQTVPFLNSVLYRCRLYRQITSKSENLRNCDIGLNRLNDEKKQLVRRAKAKRINPFTQAAGRCRNCETITKEIRRVMGVEAFRWRRKLGTLSHERVSYPFRRFLFPKRGKRE